jgi:hypothetical protein
MSNSELVKGFTRKARAIVPALLFLAIAALGARPTQALPSYARQTGQQCAACHNGFPELTPYGRLFKLNGYTFTGGTLDVPPLAMMLIPTFSHTGAGQPGGAAPRFGVNDNFAFTGSAFYGGKIIDNVGAFAQFTYDEVPNTIHWDNLDQRYANSGNLAGQELVYGVSFNNNPTVEDAWNSTPAWGYPYLASVLAPAPAAHTLIEGGFAQQVVGFMPYIYWNRLLYVSAGGYRTLGPWTQFALGIDPSATSAISGVAPSWRIAVEPAWGNNTFEVGTFGLSASLVPGRMAGAGTDRVTDFGFDTQYQYLGARDAFSLQGRFISEYQALGASSNLGLAANPHNRLRSYSVKGSYWYEQTYGVTVGYFNTNGSTDPLLYGGVSANNSPSTRGWIFELNYMPFNYGGPDFWPWLNAKFGVQYVRYDKFNGTSDNFDGMGRNARNNNTLFVFAWLAF